MPQTDGRAASAPRALPSYPLSQEQQRIFRECKQDPDSPIHHIAYGFRLPAKVDMKRLVQAVRDAVDAHPQLKARIAIDAAGRPCMHRHDDDASAVRMEFLSEGGLETWTKAFLRPFGLIGGALYRLSVVKAYRATYLFCDFHRMVSDDASLSVFLTDVSAAYTGTKLSAETWTGFDVAANERTLRRGQALADAKSFYRKSFAAAPARSVLPDLAGTGSAGKGEVTLSTQVSLADAREFCDRAGVGPDALANVAYALLLGVYTNAQEALFTSLCALRPDARDARTVSQFCRVLPSKLEWSATDAPQDLMRRFADQRTSFCEQVPLSLDELAKAAGTAPVLQFSYDGEAACTSELCGYEVEVVTFARDAGTPDLFMRVYPESSQLMLHVTFQTSLFSEGFARTFAQTYAALLSGLLSADEVGKIGLLSSEQKAELDSFNRAVVGEEPPSVLAQFRTVAAAHPMAPAVLVDGDELGYGQLDRRSDDVAAHVALAGAGANDVVLLLVPRDALMVVAPLGVLKAGAAYLPLSTTMSREQVDTLVKQANAKLLVTTTELRVLARGYDGPVLYLPDASVGASFSDALRLEGVGGKKVPAKPAVPQVAYVPENLFALPSRMDDNKSAMAIELTHGNVAELVAWYNATFNLGALSHVGACASLSSAESLIDLFCPLAVGATVCVGPSEERATAFDLAELFGSASVSHLHLSAKTVAQIAPLAGWRGLKAVLATGAFDGGVVMPRRVELYRRIGVPEAAGCVACKREDAAQAGPSAGTAVNGVRLYVVDASLRRLPVGACGELLVAGPRVGAGYRGLPEQTAEVFVDNPFDNEDFARAVRSGLVARYRQNGEIELVDPVVAEVPTATAEDDAELNEERVVEEPVRVEDDLTDAWQDDEPEAEEPEPPSAPRPKRSGRTSSVRRSAQGAIAAGTEASPLRGRRREAPDEVSGDAAVAGEDGTAENTAPADSAADATLVPGTFLREGEPERTGEYSARKNVPGTSVASHLASYDYSAINRLLASNRSSEVGGVCAEGLGDILLVGVDSLLGAYVLRAFLTHMHGRAWCLVPASEERDPEGYLASLLLRHTGEPFDELMGERVMGVAGGYESAADIDKLSRVPFRTLVNCASLTADDPDSLPAGAAALADLCAHAGRRLVQVSSARVAGEGDAEMRFSEQTLYVGQSFAAPRDRALFLAEREVLERVASGWLDAKVIRTAELGPCPVLGDDESGRASGLRCDELVACAEVGAFPMGWMEVSLNLSPVDKVAEALLRLGGSSSRFSLFHAMTSHSLQMGDAVFALRAAGRRMRVVSDSYFARLLADYVATHDACEEALRMTERMQKSVKPLEVDVRFSMQALYRLGWKWPLVDDAYLRRTLG